MMKYPSGSVNRNKQEVAWLAFLKRASRRVERHSVRLALRHGDYDLVGVVPTRKAYTNWDLY